MFDEIELGHGVSRGAGGDRRGHAAILARGGRCEARRLCGGALHRGDYARKPRGGLVAAAAEAFARRFVTVEGAG